MFSIFHCQNGEKIEISENFWSLLVFLDLPRGGSTKNHTGEANAFFPLFLPKVKSIPQSSMPKLTTD